MATLASDLIAVFNETYKDCTPTRALAILNEVDEEVLAHIPLRKTSVVLAAIVAGTLGGEQNEYAIDEKVIKIWGVRWFTSATDWVDLEETHVDELDVNNPGWRSGLASVPSHFYTNADTAQGLIGFFPNPSVATVAGFPNARVYCTQRTALLIGTAMPLEPQIRRLYVNGMRYIHALDRHKSDAPMYRAIFQDDLAQQVQLTMTRAGRVNPQINQVSQRANWRRRGVCR